MNNKFLNIDAIYELPDQITSDSGWFLVGTENNYKLYYGHNLIGPFNFMGVPGPKGDTGIQGVQGARGPKGDKGEQGDIGLTGPIGQKGDKGDKGDKGEQGDPGESAFLFTVVAKINTVAELPSPSNLPRNYAYLVDSGTINSADDKIYDLYIITGDSPNLMWTNIGPLNGVINTGNVIVNSSPNYVDTSSTILALPSDHGVAVATDTGHWYYWNGSAYADGGVYQARELGDGSVKYGNISDALKNVTSDKNTVSCYTTDISSSTSGATDGIFWTSNNLSFTKGVTIARVSFNSSISGSGTIAIAKPSGANYEIIESFSVNFNQGLNNVDLDYYCNENVFVFLDCAVKYNNSGIYSLVGFSKSGNTLTQTTGLYNSNFAVSVLYFESKSLDENYKKMLKIKETSIKAYGTFTSSDQIPRNQIWGHSLLSAISGSIIKSVTLKGMNGNSSIKIYLAEKNNGVLEKKEEYIFSLLKNGDNICNINFYCEKETYVIFEPLTANSGFKYQSGGGSGSLNNYSLSGNTFTQTQSLTNLQLYAEIEITALTGNVGNVLEVSKKGDKDFKTINEALNFAYSIESRENPITILVYPSVYKEVCNVGGNHFVSIVGINKNDCIIRDDSGVYNNVPIRICGNAYIANLTIIATHNDDSTYETKARNPESFDDTNGSYALHIDDLHANDNYDYLTVVENCYLYSEQNAAIGIGMQKNMTLKVINCECVKKVSDAIYNHSVLRTGKFGAVFFHNVSLNQYGGNSGYQKFIMDNCRLKVNKGVCFNTENLGSGGTVTFYNNILYSDELGKTNVYSNLIPNSLTEDSFGNNINDMNSN